MPEKRRLVYFFKLSRNSIFNQGYLGTLQFVPCDSAFCTYLNYVPRTCLDSVGLAFCCYHRSRLPQILLYSSSLQPLPPFLTNLTDVAPASLGDPLSLFQLSGGTALRVSRLLFPRAANARTWPPSAWTSLRPWQGHVARSRSVTAFTCLGSHYRMYGN
jgi:hypothetical protein